MPDETDTSAQVHRLVTDRELDQLLGNFEAPKASPELLDRVMQSAEITPQRSSMSPVIVPLMQAAAVLVIALGLGIWAGMDASSSAKTQSAQHADDLLLGRKSSSALKTDRQALVVWLRKLSLSTAKTSPAKSFPERKF